MWVRIFAAAKLFPMTIKLTSFHLCNIGHSILGSGFPSCSAESFWACRCSSRTSGLASTTPSTTRPTTWRRFRRRGRETSAAPSTRTKRNEWMTQLLKRFDAETWCLKMALLVNNLRYLTCRHLVASSWRRNASTSSSEVFDVKTSSSFKDLSEKFASGEEIGSFEKRARKNKNVLAHGSKSSRAAKAVTNKKSKVV